MRVTWGHLKGTGGHLMSTSQSLGRNMAKQTKLNISFTHRIKLERERRMENPESLLEEHMSDT